MLDSKKMIYLIALAMTLLFSLGMNNRVHAGDYFERNGIAIDGYDAVAYFSENKAVKGMKEFATEYKGSIFHFSSAANRDKFQNNPESYVPQFGGFCAYGAAGGYKAKIDPTAFSIVDGKLYLNYNDKVQSLWNKDVGGYIEKAKKLWPTVAGQTKVSQ
jgi:YHS domain-containing protein